MFTTEMKEKYEKSVVISDVSPRAVGRIFDFMYSDEIELSTDSVKAILHAASVMQIPDLLAVINDFLSDVLDPPNCLRLRELGRFYSLDKLTAKSQNCILENFEKVASQNDFTELSMAYMEEILSSDELMVASESIVYEALVKWMRNQLDERRDCFPRLFKRIRLQLIPAEYLSAHVSKEPLVREFHVCRDLVDEAFRFHLKLNKGKVQRPRKGQRSETNAVALFSPTRDLHIFNLESRQWSYVTDANMMTPTGSCIAAREVEIYLCIGDQSRRFSSYANGTWTNETQIPSIRCESQAVFVKEKLYLIGGHNRSSAAYSDILSYEFETKKWSTLCNLRSPRRGMAAIAHEDNVYVLGGYTQYGASTACCLVEVLNTSTKQWTQKPNMNTERAMFGAVLFNERIYAFGGIGNNNIVLSSVEFMDVDENIWTNLRTEIPAELGANSVCRVGNRVAILGKEKKLLCFDPCTGTWRIESQVLPSVMRAQLVAMHWNDDTRQ